MIISHADLAHIGALPYAVSRLGLNCPIYTTLPVYKMGQMLFYDLVQAKKTQGEFGVFNLDNVDAAFELVVPMKYSQHLSLSGKGQGITITPYAAGHTIGGAIWKIRKDTEEIVYAMDYNHKKER